MTYRMRCGKCGRYISEPADSYFPFGSYNDEEPPDEVLLCKKCLESLINYCKKHKTMPHHWVPANFEKGLAKELGFEWHQDEGSAWGYWKRRESS